MSAVRRLAAAWHRRRGGPDVGLTVSSRRERRDGVNVLVTEIDSPADRAAELIEALADVVAEGVASIALTVGWVGVVAGEEPVLVALAPARDLVAPRFRDALAAGQAHRRPNVWLTLPPGRYLASVVDPYRPFGGGNEEVAAIVRSAGAVHALTSRLGPGPAGVRISLVLYAARPELRRLLRMARNGLGELPGWRAASQTAPARPSTLLNPRFQR